MRRDSREGCRRLCPHRQPRILTRPAMSWPDLPDTNLCFHQGSREGCRRPYPHRQPRIHTRPATSWPDPPDTNPSPGQNSQESCCCSNRHRRHCTHTPQDLFYSDHPDTNPVNRRRQNRRIHLCQSEMPKPKIIYLIVFSFKISCHGFYPPPVVSKKVRKNWKSSSSKRYLTYFWRELKSRYALPIFCHLQYTQ